MKPGKTGNRVTPFGRAMYELFIDTFCANNSAKGRVERAHLTLQDRLVKEMRLREINTVADANAYALLHGRLQHALREAAKERLQCASAVTDRREPTGR